MNAHPRLSQIVAFSLYCLLTLGSVVHAGHAHIRPARRAGWRQNRDRQRPVSASHVSGNAFRQNLP